MCYYGVGDFLKANSFHVHASTVGVPAAAEMNTISVQLQWPVDRLTNSYDAWAVIHVNIRNQSAVIISLCCKSVLNSDQFPASPPANRSSVKPIQLLVNQDDT